MFWASPNRRRCGEIKRAFRKLAKQYHPDRAKNDPKAAQKFQEVTSAYDILGDSAKRAQFDRGEIGADGKQRFSGFDGFPGKAGAAALAMINPL